MNPLIKMGLLIMAVIITMSAFPANTADAESSEKILKIERFVEEQKNKSKIPGISLVIVERVKIVYQRFKALLEYYGSDILD